MYHRYGRHGPHAWKRWRQQKFQQRLPVLAPSVAVVRVYIPIEAERIIIIIMQQPQEFDERDEENTPPISFPESRLIGPSQDERTRVHDMLKEKAEFEAETKYDNDKQSVLDRGEKWPVDKAIEREASVKANVALRPLVGSGIDIDVEKRWYVNSYIEKYRLLYERDMHDGTLPNEQTERITAEAQRDARNDKQENIDLSEEELTIQAAIRLQSLFMYQSHASSGYLTHILAHLPRYKHAYKEERDRQPRSGPFQSGNWQAPGTRYP